LISCNTNLFCAIKYIHIGLFKLINLLLSFIKLFLTVSKLFLNLNALLLKTLSSLVSLSFCTLEGCLSCAQTTKRRSKFSSLMATWFKTSMSSSSCSAVNSELATNTSSSSVGASCSSGPSPQRFAQLATALT